MQRDAGSDRNERRDIDDALEELTTALMDVPAGYDAFLRLSPDEQIALVDWVKAGWNHAMRSWRARLISAAVRSVLPRTDALRFD